jgi:hypothetical protein
MQSKLPERTWGFIRLLLRSLKAQGNLIWTVKLF